MTTKTTIKKSIALDALASLALDRLARHRGKSRHEVLADLIAEASRLTTKDMSREEWDQFFGKAPNITSLGATASAEA